uniref:ORF51a n=1 Tax=Pinus thunbergii TaxID=3350 RepID=Q32975_PINTH|nr:ORF51a [Pinus thunbergii]
MEAILTNESHLVQYCSYCSYRTIYLHLKNGERCYITSDKTGDQNSFQAFYS